MKIDQAYDAWAESYDRDRNLTRDLDSIVIRKVLRGLHPSVALELGCGTGKNTAYLARISESVLAVDFSKGMIAQARAKISAIHVVFRLVDLSRPWPIDPSKFDLATCNLVLEHIRDLGIIFREAHRVLRAGGRLFISELHPYRQYQEKQARFRANRKEVVIAAFRHNISDFLREADRAGFSLLGLNEWWHAEDDGKPPRLVSMIFGKSIRPNKALQRARAQGMKLSISRASERKRYASRIGS